MEAGVEQALQDVLVKVSGNKFINTLQPVQAITRAPDSMVQQFTYDDLNTDVQNLGLTVQFDSDMVDHVLQETGQSIWAGKRAQTLVLFVYNYADGGNLLSAEDVAASYFKAAADRRGVTLLFPISDIANNVLLNPSVDSDVVNDYLQKLAKQYHVQQVLFGREVSLDTRFEWQLYAQDDQYAWQGNADDQRLAISQAVDHVVDDMVSRAAVFQGENMQSVLHVSVDHIHDLQAYKSLLKLCKNASVIAHFSVAEVLADKVILNVTAKGGSVALSAFFAENSPSLKAVTDPAAYDHVDMAYSWLVV